MGGPTSGGILGFPPAISQLVLITVIVFLLQNLFPHSLIDGFALVPAQVVTQGRIWELATYIFLHGGLMHILFNMFYLVMFGAQLENYWGSREFVKYFFITGIGAGVVHVITSYLGGGSPLIPTIGASGAIFGVLIAYGMTFPNQTILLWFVIPISARTLVAIAAFIELAMTVQYHGGDGVARFAHLGGMLVGYVYLKRGKLTRSLHRHLGSVLQAGQGKRSDSHQDEEHRQRIDAILEKISREGFGSLTEEERRLLEESAARARRRQQGRDDRTHLH